MAKVYRADGTIEDYPEPANGKDYQLAELRAAIGGGFIQVVGLAGRQIMIVDEEGKLKGFPRNDHATALARGHIFPGDYIAGDALVCRARQMR